MPGPAPKVPLQQLFGTCETLYQRDGFVRWADVAKVHGISRQGVQLRFKKALETGELDEATYKRWESASSRRAVTAQRAQERKYTREARAVRITLSPENKAWLEQQWTERNVTSADIINGLLNKARMR